MWLVLDKDGKMKPTKEEIMELWKWCGFKRALGKLYWYPDGGSARRMPLADLSNLFKYAMPKTIGELMLSGIGNRESWNKVLRIWMDFYFEGMGLEDALFWAIYEARGER